MNPSDAELFLSSGYIRLQAFHSKARLTTVKQGLLDEMKRLGGTQGFSRSMRKLPVFQQIGKLSAAVKVEGAHEVLVTPELTAHVTHLAGKAPSNVQDTQLLLSPSRQGAWTLDGLNWHVDIVAGRRDRIPGIQGSFSSTMSRPTAAQRSRWQARTAFLRGTRIRLLPSAKS